MLAERFVVRLVRFDTLAERFVVLFFDFFLLAERFDWLLFQSDWLSERLYFRFMSFVPFKQELDSFISLFYIVSGRFAASWVPPSVLAIRYPPVALSVMNIQLRRSSPNNQQKAFSFLLKNLPATASGRKVPFFLY